MSLSTLEKVKRKLEKIRHNTKNIENYVYWRLGQFTRDSVYFYTLHKCASTLFSGYALQNMQGLRHVNYESQLYRGK